MTEIAPWENPDLPAPLATIEREIEGRARRFALWQWDERLVWHDLERPSLWWVTLDEAGTLDDWERAIEAERFGRATSQSYKMSGYGPRVGLARRVRFKALDYGKRRKFHLISDADGRGIARASEDDLWWPFPPQSDTRPLKRVRATRVRSNASKKV